jgi:Protein of unknown function (DUF962)
MRQVMRDHLGTEPLTRGSAVPINVNLRGDTMADSLAGGRAKPVSDRKRSSLRLNPVLLVRDFFVDYFSRHTNNWNRALHVVGVPLAPFLFLYLLATGQLYRAAAAFVAGYLLQWIGHTIEGNEVGEVILAKWIARKLVAAVTPGAVKAGPLTR